MTGQNRGSCTRSSSSRFLHRLGGPGAGAEGNVSVCGVEELVQTSMFRVFPSTPPDPLSTPALTRRHLTDIAGSRKINRKIRQGLSLPDRDWRSLETSLAEPEGVALALPGGKLLDSLCRFASRHGLGVVWADVKDHPPEPLRLGPITAFFGQDGEAAQAEVAVNARVGVDDLPGDQPVEEHPQACQVLLDGWRSVAGRQFGQIGRYAIALDSGQAQALGVRPGEKPHGVAVIAGSRVLVGDGVGEEGEEPLSGLVALVGDDGGQDEAAASGCQGSGGGGSGQFGGHCTAGISLSTRFRLRRIMEKSRRSVVKTVRMFSRSAR